VKVGVTLKMYDYFTYRPKSPAEIADEARKAEALGFDSVWVMDHVFIQRRWGRVLSHEPMLTLAHVAAATSRITIGTLVLSHAFRHVVQLAREASALAASSSGRFVLGLGTGWHQPEFDALGLPYDHRVGRLEEALGPLQLLLRGEKANLSGKWLALSDASIAVTSPAPSLWIAAEGPRMLALAARADGWTHAYWGAGDTGRFEAGLTGLHEALERAGRRRSEVETSASIACVIGPWDEPSEGFREPELAVGSATELAQVVRRYANAGADHVILSLSPDPYAEIDPAALDKAAEILELAREA
jgi:alkanesulfonate monooxygenase SsuD/methylene tetrahydromethanopterin reductase-like flavin-dependent oxidoreductase (luciferase family)